MRGAKLFVPVLLPSEERVAGREGVVGGRQGCGLLSKSESPPDPGMMDE